MKKTALALAAILALTAGTGFASGRQGTLEILYGRYTVNDARFAAIYSKSGSIGGLALSAALFFNLDFYLETKVLPHRARRTIRRPGPKFS